MIDLDKVEGFDWDTGNARKNDKHNVTQAEAEQVFLNEPLFITPDEKHSGSERRYRALGETAIGRQLTVIFTLRQAGALVRVISARNMNAKERKLYEQEIKSNPEI
ncbi:MAG: BrnT family toxin [Thermodesulfovibrionales bacterium]